MRALVCRALGDATRPPERGGALAVETLPSPHPDGLPPRGVRVRVHAAGLNFADLLMVAGQYQERPPLPFIPGGEFAGIITEIGEDVRRSRAFRVGQAVAGVVTGGGAMADEAVIPDAAAGCLPVPDGMTLEQAAAFPVAYGTSHVALVHRAGLGPGDRVLVLGAAGGVGLAAVQIAKARGAVVVAVATGAEKVAACRAAGADHCLDASALVPDQTRAGSNPNPNPNKRTNESIAQDPNARPYAGLKSAVARALGDHRGVDVLFDPVGGDAFSEGFRAVRWGGHALVIGFACGKIPKLPLNLALVKNVTVHGVYWGAHATRDPETLARSFRDLARMAAEGRLDVSVSHAFPLERAWEAFEALAKRKAVGKVVVTTGAGGGEGGGGGGRSRL